MPAVVSIKNARKSFGEVEVLRDISLEVARGEVVAVIGPSGGGKSTLLRCMTLLETLDAGGLSYGEVDAAVPGEDGTSVYAKGDVLKRARPGVSELQPVSAFHGDAQHHGRADPRAAS